MDHSRHNFVTLSNDFFSPKSDPSKIKFCFNKNLDFINKSRWIFLHFNFRFHVALITSIDGTLEVFISLPRS